MRGGYIAFVLHKFVGVFMHVIESTNGGTHICKVCRHICIHIPEPMLVALQYYIKEYCKTKLMNINYNIYGKYTSANAKCI